MGRAFSSVFAEAPLGLKSISFEAENALSAATDTGQWTQPDCYRLEPSPRNFSHYFFLGGVAIFVSEGADAATFGFSFFGFLASLLLRTWPFAIVIFLWGGSLAASIASSGRRLFQLKVGRQDRTLGLKNPISTYLRDAIYYRKLSCS
jgi:hypothetical protein